MSIFAALALALLVPGAALADDHVWIALLGPIGQLPQPRPDYTLEIGDLGCAWTAARSMPRARLPTARQACRSSCVAGVFPDCVAVVSFLRHDALAAATGRPRA